MLTIGRKLNGTKASYLILHFYPYSSSSTISTSTQEQTSSSVADFLVTSLGFSKQQSLITSTKLCNYSPHLKPKKVIDTPFAANAISVINFFRQHGFDDAHIRKAVSSEPRILAANVDKTLKPKFDLLKDLGFCGSDLVSFVSRNPIISRTTLGNAVQALRVVLVSDEDVVSVLKKSAHYAMYHSAKHLVSNVGLLENEYGIPGDTIRRSILRNSRPFLQNTEVFKDTVRRVEHELEIPRHSGMFLYGIQTLVSLHKITVESKWKLFQSFGWSEADVAAMIRSNPLALMASEVRIKNALKFYMNELGYEPSFLATRPTMLMLSIQRRVLPRYRIWLVLMEKGVLRKKYSFYCCLYISEDKFFQKFVKPYNDVLPELSQKFLNTIGYLSPTHRKRKGNLSLK